MVRTLRITSVIMAIAAAVLLIFLAVYGVRPDPQIEDFLKEPSALDKFTSAMGQRPTNSENQDSPLIKQAADLARYLNPPPPPPPPMQAAANASTAPAPPIPVSAKFDLIGTSFYATRPEQSLALIDEPGKGLHWVRQGSNIAHLTIEKVGDGSITVRDGQRTFEMTVKVQELWKELLKNPPPETSSADAVKSPPSSATATQSPPSSTGVPSRPMSMRQRAEEFRRARGGTIGTPRQTGPPDTTQAGPAPAATPPPQPAPPARVEPVVEVSPQEKEIDAKINKLAAELASSKITDDEAAKINEEMFKLIEKLGEIRTSQYSAGSQPESPSQPDANLSSPAPDTDAEANK